MHNIMNIKTSGGDASGNQDGVLSQAERPNAVFTLPLGAIAVDRHTGEVLVEQEIVQLVSGTLAIDEDDGSCRRSRQQKVLDCTTLHGRLHKHNILLDVQVRAAGAPDPNTDVNVSEMLLSQIPSRLGKGGGEQEIFDVSLFLIYFKVSLSRPEGALTYHRPT